MKELEKHIQHRRSLCFLDLEGTQFSHEMIALGAVKVDLRRDMTIKKYHQGYYSLVKAKNKIGKVVTDLTGITEDMVKKDGKSFRVVVKELKEYLGKDFSKTLFVTFGSHDLRILSQSLAYNLDASKDDVYIMIKHAFDLSDFISTFVKDDNNNTYSLSNMLKVFGVDFKGTQHDAYADALNLAYLYEAMLEHRDVMKNEYLKVLNKYKHLPEPIHQIVVKLTSGESVTPEDFAKLVEDSLQ
jgi:DNA polymerase III epsilon subunit-like protein